MVVWMDSCLVWMVVWSFYENAKLILVENENTKRKHRLVLDSRMEIYLVYIIFMIYVIPHVFIQANTYSFYFTKLEMHANSWVFMVLLSRTWCFIVICILCALITKIPCICIRSWTHSNHMSPLVLFFCRFFFHLKKKTSQYKMPAKVHMYTIHKSELDSIH